MSNGETPFPLPPIFPPRPRPGFPFPFEPPRPPREPGIPPDFDPTAPRASPVVPLPVPTGGVGFPRVPGEIRQFPFPGANEPFGGKTIRIGRILKGVGIGTVLIIGAEILVEVITRKQLRKMGEILERQDAEIAEEQLQREMEKRRAKEVDIRPGRLELPQIGGLEIPAPPVEETLPAPVETPRPRPAIPETLPEISPIILEPVPIAPELPSPVPAIDPGPLASPGQIPRPISAPLPAPLPGPVAVPSAPPVEFPVFEPVAFPEAAPIGDVFPAQLTSVQPSDVPLGTIETAAAPGLQAQAQPQRCEAVKRRRRRKGKCREGFFIERPGKTEFITWREGECDTSGQSVAERILEVVK